MQVSFQAGQSSSVIVLRLTSRDGSPTADVVYYVRLLDILLSDADVVGCPASIGSCIVLSLLHSAYCGWDYY